MKPYFWIFGFLLITIILVLLVIQTTVPDVSVIERSAIINAPDSVVHDQIATIKNWERWSPTRAANTQTVMRYSRLVSGKGAYYTWQSGLNKDDSSKLTIVVDEPNRIGYVIETNSKTATTAYFQLKPIYNTTEVSWRIECETLTPIDKLMAMMMENKTSFHLEKALHCLDSVCVRDKTN